MVFVLKEQNERLRVMPVTRERDYIQCQEYLKCHLLQFKKEKKKHQNLPSAHCIMHCFFQTSRLLLSFPQYLWKIHTVLAAQLKNLKT